MLSVCIKGTASATNQIKHGEFNYILKVANQYEIFKLGPKTKQTTSI